jgi:predicted nucleotidyltransferase
MFLTEKESLKRAVKRLKKISGENLVTVVAFGSRVRGTFSGESDFDILVIVHKRTSQLIDTINEVFIKEEDKTGIPYSVVIKTDESFEKEKQYNTTFYRNIKKEGVLLYGRA